MNWVRDSSDYRLRKWPLIAFGMRLRRRNESGPAWSPVLLAIRDHQLLRCFWYLHYFASGETRIPKHAIVFGKRIGVAGWRRAEHHEAERGRNRRRNAVLIGDKLQRDGTAGRLQASCDFAHQ